MAFRDKLSRQRPPQYRTSGQNYHSHSTSCRRRDALVDKQEGDVDADVFVQVKRAGKENEGLDLDLR